MVRPGALPGAGGWSVAVQDPGLVLVPGDSGAVGIYHEGPAEPVDHDLVMVIAEQHAVAETGLAAAGPGLRMVHVAGPGGLVASAGPLAVLVAKPYGVPDVGGNRVAVTDVQRTADPAKPQIAELLLAQE